MRKQLKSHQHSSSPHNVHQQRLRQSKKIYDQLHHSNLKMFVVRKHHLANLNANMSQDKSSNRASQQFRSEGKIDSRTSEKYNLSQEKFQQDTRKVKKLSFQSRNSDLEDLSQIKKILSGSLKKKRSQYQGNVLEGNLGQSRVRFRGPPINKVKEPKIRSRSLIEKSKRQISEKIGPWDQMNKERKSSFQQQIVKRQVRKSQHKKRTELSDILQQRQSKMSEDANKIIHKKTWLDSYLNFINCSQDNRQFYIHLNFDSIKRMKAEEAWQNLDLKNARLIEGIMGGIADNIKEYNTVSSEKIKDLCILYFNNHQKIRMELILKEHYFKLFAFRLNPIFIYQRIVVYFVFLFVKCGATDFVWVRARIKETADALRTIYQLLSEIVSEAQQSKKQKMKGVGQTFKILKSVGQVERKVSLLQDKIDEMVKYVQSNQNQVRCPEIIQVHRILSSFIHEEPYGPRSYESFIKMQMLMSWKYLRVPPTPFLPAQKPDLNYTMVLDLDETLIYYNQEQNILRYRPGLDTFLRIIKALKFEVILFSASTKIYADTIAAEIQTRGKVFDFRLYKEHLSLCKGRLSKDIRRLGRDLAKTVIIDDIATNFQPCIQNGIEVSSWTGSKSDTQLITILRFLKDLVEQRPTGEQKEVQECLKEWRRQFAKMLEKAQQRSEQNQFLEEKQYDGYE